MNYLIDVKPQSAVIDHSTVSLPVTTCHDVHLCVYDSQGK